MKSGRTAHAIVFPTVDKVEIQSYDLSSLQADEILIRTEYSGVSQGTETWTLKGQRPELQFPTVPGYQSVGRVEAVGENVARSGLYTQGQRVLFRTSRLPEGWPSTWMGAHVSHALVPILQNGNLCEHPPVLIPDDIDPVQASLSALAAVSLRGLQMLTVNIGDLVVVNGQGLIGQFSAQLALLRGAIVVTTDISSMRLQTSLSCGANRVINAKDEAVASIVRSIKPAGADVVIETTGRHDQFAPCIDLLRWEGQLLLQGWYAQPISFDFQMTHAKKPTVAITCGYDEDGNRQILQLIRWQKLQLQKLISHCVPVTSAPEIYQKMLDNSPDLMGVVFDWSAL